MARMRDVRQNKVKKSLTGSLFAAQVRLVEAVGLKESAALLGRSIRQTQRFINPSAERYFTVEEIFALEVAAGRMFVTGWLAMAQQGALLKLPRDYLHKGIHARMGRVGAKASALFGAYAEHCGADAGKLSADHKGDLAGKTQESMSAHSELLAVLRRSA